MQDLALAVDLGATRCRVAVVDRLGRVLARAEHPTHAAEGYQRCMAELVAVLKGFRARAGGDVVGVGLALASPTEVPRGVLRNPPNLPGWEGFPIGRYLEEALGLPVYAENDANAAVVGEHLFGMGQRARHLVYLTVSTGIGGGVLVDGELLRGPQGLAGEVRHLELQRDGPPCGCGSRACLEALDSGTAIARRGRERLQQGAESRMRALVDGDVARLRAEEVLHAAAEGDPVALEVVAEAADYLALGIIGLVHIFTPQVVVLGGGVCRALMLFYPRLLTRVRSGVYRHLRDDVRLVPAALGDDAGLVGAAALAFRMA